MTRIKVKPVPTVDQCFREQRRIYTVPRERHVAHSRQPGTSRVIFCVPRGRRVCHETRRRLPWYHGVTCPIQRRKKQARTGPQCLGNSSWGCTSEIGPRFCGLYRISPALLLLCLGPRISGSEKISLGRSGPMTGRVRHEAR